MYSEDCLHPHKWHCVYGHARALYQAVHGCFPRRTAKVGEDARGVAPARAAANRGLVWRQGGLYARAHNVHNGAAEEPSQASWEEMMKHRWSP